MQGRALSGFGILIGLFLGCCTAVAQVAEKPVRIGDFSLIDHQGTQWTLKRLGYRKGIVILTQSNHCAQNIDLLPKYKLLRTEWESRGFEFLMMNSAAGDDIESVRRVAKAYDVDFPIMLDESQLVAESLKVTQAGEVLVIEPQSRTLLYRGPLLTALTNPGPYDLINTGAVGRANFPEALKQTLTAAAEGNAAGRASVSLDVTNGCALTFPDRADHVPDYATEVAPILIENCTHCHVEGGIAPFAMNRHRVVRGFAPMIREVLMTKRMPPMQVDPHYNHFLNKTSIPKKDLQTLVHWVDAGAPRGDSPVDPLEEKVKPLQTQWQLGKPDYIVEVPPFDIPATGIIDYVNRTVSLPFKEDKWVRAVQFIPGDTRVLHHLVTYITTPETKDGEQPVSEEVPNFLEGYAPGKADASVFPEGTGVFIPKGHKIAMQIHYTPIGVPVTDRTRFALYFYDKAPERSYQTYGIAHWASGALEIPPGAVDHRMNHSYVIPEDILLYAVRPHMHFRGTAFRFTAVYPDMRSEILLNVSRYDFNWQPTYRLAEPKLVPAGTRIIIDGVYDNTKYNPGNPGSGCQGAGWAAEQRGNVCRLHHVYAAKLASIALAAEVSRFEDEISARAIQRSVSYRPGASLPAP